MVVYRIQDTEGRGPYRPGFSDTWVRETQDDRLLPWFMEMGPIHLRVRPGMHAGCGCTSLSQLRMWFNEQEYTTLLGFGYRAVQLNVDRILGRSLTQCVFERQKPLAEDAVPLELYGVVVPVK